MGTITVTNTNDSGPGSLRNAIVPSHDESTQSEGQDILFGHYSETSPETGKKLKQLRPLGQQLYSSSTEESNEDWTGESQDSLLGDYSAPRRETDQVAESDGVSSLASVRLTIVGSASLVTNTPLPYKIYTLTSESSPVVDKTIVVTNTNDSGSGSLRDAVAPSQDQSTESAVQDILTGEGYSLGNDSFQSSDGVRPIFANTPIPFPATNPSPSFNDTLDGEVFSSQVAESDGVSSLANKTITLTSGQLFLSQPVESGGISPLANESITLTSGSSPVEVSLLLPAVQSAREAARLSGTSSSDGTWALGSIFELTSREIGFSRLAD